MMHKFRLLLVKTICLVIGLCIVVIPTLQARASAATYKLLEAIPHAYYNPKCDTNTPTPAASTGATTTATGSSYYILGDSITARAATTYTKAFTDKGSTSTISSRVGRSWTMPGQDDSYNTTTQGTGKEAVAKDAGTVEAPGPLRTAGAIIVALGTNGLNANEIDEVITTLKGINSTAPIYWVNVAIIGNSSVPGYNKQLQARADAGKIKLIDWAGTVDPAPGDGTHDPGNIIEHKDVNAHPTSPDGVNKLVNLVIGTVSKGGATAPAAASSTSCCSTGQQANATATSDGKTTDLSYKDSARNNRDVGATVYMPSSGSSWPLVMFAPGRDVNSKANDPNGIYKRYLTAIAAQGFLVVGANFSDNHSAGAVPSEVEDIKFLITQVQQEAKLQGKIKAEAGVALVGHSDGGMVATLAGYGSNKDPRLTAVISEDGVMGLSDAGPPLLLMVGSNDGDNVGGVKGGYTGSKASYTALTVFNGASHFHYITGAARGDNVTSEDSFHPAVDAVTGAFLKRMLNKDTSDATSLNKVISASYSSQVTLSEKGNDTIVSGGSASPSTTPANPTNTACCAPGSSPASTVSGTDGAAIVWNYLVTTMQLSAPQAAGILGNMEKESSFNPTIVNPRSGAYGIIQWFAGRLTALQNFAQSKGKDKSDINVQLEFMKTELEGSYYKPRVLDPIKATDKVEVSTRVWLENMEVPCSPPGAACDPEFKDRLPRSMKYITLFGSNTGTPSDVTGTNPGVSTGCGGGGAPGEYKNPLRDVQGLKPLRVDEGVDYSADGPVYALGNGTVTLAKAGTSEWPGGNWISYKLTDGPAAGKTVFVAENCDGITLSAGDKVDSSTKLCTMHSSYPFIETGWAVDEAADLAMAHSYYNEADVTAHGVNFDQLMQKLGVPAGTQSKPPTGQLPGDWPKF